MQITGTAAIVTGGASGLGGATARALAAKGAQVFALDLPSGIEKAETIEGVTYLPADVTSPEEVQAAVDTASSSGPALRIVVNCAGIGPSSRTVGKTGPHDLDLYRKVIEINLVGSFNVASKFAARAMTLVPSE